MLSDRLNKLERGADRTEVEISTLKARLQQVKSCSTKKRPQPLPSRGGEVREDDKRKQQSTPPSPKIPETLRLTTGYPPLHSPRKENNPQSYNRTKQSLQRQPQAMQKPAVRSV
eukprot:2119163-Rhodomonas_salina.1